MNKWKRREGKKASIHPSAYFEFCLYSHGALIITITRRFVYFIYLFALFFPVLLFVREDNDDENDEEDSENSLESFIDEEEDEANSPSFYAEVDQAMAALPYFPLAFAKSKDEPLKFNFELAVLDSLELPCHILEPAEVTLNDTKVTFSDRKEAVQYCQQKLAPWRDQARRRTQAQSHQTLDSNTRRTMFMDEGRPLESLLKCGIEDLDQNLYRVREDR